MQVETLRGKVKGVKMGDKVAQARPAELGAKLKRMKEKRDREEKARLEELSKPKKRSKGDFLEMTGAAGVASVCECRVRARHLSLLARRRHRADRDRAVRDDHVPS